MSNTRGRIFWTVFAFVIILIGTTVVIRFAKGYRPSRENLVDGNGLLVANSSPTGARISVDGRFTSATNDTLYLAPGTYDVEIAKDGYTPWKKRLSVEKELVTQANALLFPIAPSLTPLTFAGAKNITPSPDGQRLAFYTASASATNKNGFYLQELTDNPLALQRTPKQFAEPSALFPADTTTMVWSPNSSQLLLISEKRAVLVDPSRLSRLDDAADVSLQLNTIFSQWEEEMYLRDRERLAKFPPFIQEVATASAVNAYFSPDEERLLYTATNTFTIPDTLLPAKPGSSTQAQERTTIPGGIYVYDRDEDRQFRVGTDDTFFSILTASPSPSPAPRNRRITQQPVQKAPVLQKHLLAVDLAGPATRLAASPSAFMKLRGETALATAKNFLIYHSPLYSHGVQWFPTSLHLLTVDPSSITITESDGTNAVKVYSGPFDTHFVYPWPNGSRVIMVTNFSAGAMAPANLYTIELR